ncbi:MAG: zeta toxin family protein [Planctomycetota bacterium]|nr:zeta toxin family protein [Planctomycetota bacterium]
MARAEQPDVVVLAGPNGSGKSTTAPALLRDRLGLTEFVNADVLAQGLSAFDPLGAALEAGRVMLERLHHLAAQRLSFAFETTLASRSFAPWLAQLIQTGYRFHLLFLWLPSADLAVERVKARVRMGGHDVPEPIVRRRYMAGLRNFFELYQPIATAWQVYDNERGFAPVRIADGEKERVLNVIDQQEWNDFKRAAEHEV